MHFLRDSGLKVSVLDPGLDRDKLGSRYCAGGYIWQVEDEKLGPLLSGPFYPDPTTPFDGQGAPEVFEIALGQGSVAVDGEVCVLGVGQVKRTSAAKPFHVRYNPEVIQFAEWKVEEEPGGLRMRTLQEFMGYRVEITRRLKLSGRQLESRTYVANLGEKSVPLRWFAHPFFPPVEKLCRFSAEVSAPANPAFEFDPEGWLKRNPKYDWSKGFFQPLQVAFGHPVKVEQCHPLAGLVEIYCDFPLAWLPVWGNAHTFSFEPFYHDIVQPGAFASFSLRYRFGSG